MSIGHIIELDGKFLLDGMLKLEAMVNAPPGRIMAGGEMQITTQWAMDKQDRQFRSDRAGFAWTGRRKWNRKVGQIIKLQAPTPLSF